MIKTAAKIFGAVFLLVGILGFVPGITENEHLLGIFHLNLAHNLVHLASGLVALIVGFTSTQYARLYFQIFGIVYGLVAVLGFVYGDEPILGIISSDLPDTFLHIAIATTSLILGFGVKSEE